jgi:hypothetical protein
MSKKRVCGKKKKKKILTQQIEYLLIPHNIISRSMVSCVDFTRNLTRFLILFLEFVLQEPFCF